MTTEISTSTPAAAAAPLDADGKRWSWGDYEVQVRLAIAAIERIGAPEGKYGVNVHVAPRTDGTFYNHIGVAARVLSAEQLTALGEPRRAGRDWLYTLEGGIKLTVEDAEPRCEHCGKDSA